MAVKHGHWFSEAALVVPIALILVLFTAAVGGLKHIVGGSIWSIPPTKNFYDNWSSSQTLRVGDVLYFDFESEMYDVLEVRGGEYSRCEFDHAIQTYSDGPALVPLTNEGRWFYICGFFNYCSLGQKLMIYVNKSTPSPPARVP